MSSQSALMGLHAIVILFCFKKEKEDEVGSMGSWGRNWEELGKGKGYGQNMLYEIFKE